MLLFIDIDGTLINYQAKTPETANHACKKAQENGHEIILCTGCSLFEIQQRDIAFTPDGIIGGNGCYIEYHGQVLMHKTLSLEQCSHFVEWCNKRNLAFRLECNSGMYCSADFIERSAFAFNAYINGADSKEKNDGGAFQNENMATDMLIRDDVNKTAFLLNDQKDVEDAKAEFPDMLVSSWGGKGELKLFGDTSPLGVNKKAAVEFLLDYLKTDQSQSIGFGDSNSDLPMFEAVGYKVAMGSGGEGIKKAADYITSGVDEDGLMKAFQYLKLI